MTHLKKSDDHIQNCEAHDTPKPLVNPDAIAVRNASASEMVDARKANNQDGSAWLDKDIPKPVDYKSIRLIDLGTVAQLSKVQRDAESLKPRSEQHITFNELLTLEKAGNLDARRLVNEIDAAYQCTKDLKKATLNTIQDSADKVFQRGQHAESLREPSSPAPPDSGDTYMIKPWMPIRQLSRVEKIEEDAKSPGQKHLTPLDIEGLAARGDKHAVLLTNEIEAACNVGSAEQRNSMLADLQNRADRYYRRGEYFSGPAQETKPGVIDQFKTIIGGVFGKEQKRDATSEPTNKPDLGEQLKKPLQGHLEVNQLVLKQTFLNAANASIDKQYSDLGPAVLRGVGQAATNVGETLIFGASAAADGVKFMGQTLNYEFEELTGNKSAEISAQVGRESEADWIQRYAAPVAQDIEKLLEPMTTDAENIGFTGDYGRLATDPIKYAGQQYEQFSSQPAPQQVEQLTTFGAENALSGAILKGGESFVEAAKDVGAAAGKALGNVTADFETPSLRAATADSVPNDNHLAMSKADDLGGNIERQASKGSPERLLRNPQDLVNPIDKNAREFEKIGQLQQLSIENEPLIHDFIQKVDADLGSISDLDFKEPAEIEAKPLRDDVRDKKPWYDIEHVRDALRFRSAVENLNDLPKIAHALKNSGFKVINPDMDKLLQPKGRGWRMAALDLQAPNGQLIEYQVLPREMLETGKMEHGIYKQWRGKKLADMTSEEKLAKKLTDENASESYYAAWQAYLKRTGQTEDSIKQLIEQTSQILKE